MPLTMPALDEGVLKRRRAIVKALTAIVSGNNVIASSREMASYQSDGLTAYRQLPMVVVLPETTDQVSRVLRYCYDNGIKVVPRGAGTSLSGQAISVPSVCWLVRDSASTRSDARSRGFRSGRRRGLVCWRCG